jgi:zinc protease
MNYKSKFIFLLLITAFIIAGCGLNKTGLKIDFEKYTLENGLEVILHEDRSDPIAAVAIQYHVGSNREEKGRTGFAHLFEHMLFQESQHIGQDQFFKKIQNAGGTLNGGTWEDGTVYFEIVPNNALEMALWMESDRMGFLLSTITQEAFANQQQVVINEKKQRVDNNPYGHTNYVIGKLLYPEDHPYNWQVIGAEKDLRNATLKDVRDFYQKWYGPNNATLVVAGDYDREQVKQWIEKYFGEIKSSPPVEDPTAQLVSLEETKKAFHEDNFAKSPELNMVLPTVQQYHEDAYALDLFSELFADGKKAPLYKIIVEEKKLAPSVSAYQGSSEMAGVFQIRIRSFPGKSLTDVEAAISEAFKKFEDDGFTEKDLDRIKAKLETNFYNGISSILGKSFQLAQYNEYAGSPAFITEDLQNSLNVTSDDIWRVFNTYLKDKLYVLTSFVPKGKTDLIAESSERFPVVEEKVEDQKQAVETTAEDIKIEKIPSSFDRTVEPEKGTEPSLKLPEVWQDQLANGIKVFGIEHKELPLIQFSITIKGGLLLDDINKIGVANLLTDVMMEGTANKTPIELEEAIDELGARISLYTGKESIGMRVNCLKSKLNKVFELIKEILLEPRWDEKEFERVKQETIEQIHRNSARPRAIASNVFSKLNYGIEHILAYPTLGTKESVESITMDDLKKYYEVNFSPSVSHITIVGDITQGKAMATVKKFEDTWQAKDITFPEYTTPPVRKKAAVYFVDVPGAKQSQIRIGN